MKKPMKVKKKLRNLIADEKDKDKKKHYLNLVDIIKYDPEALDRWADDGGNNAPSR